MKWKTLGEAVVDDLHSFVRENAGAGQEVHIGTDSLQSRDKTAFVTVVCILTKGKGGRVVYAKDSVPRIKSLRERLLREVQRSVDLALELAPFIKGELTVSIDANPDVKFKSSEYVQSLVGYVVGQGFKAVVKPDSFASTTCADHCVRI